MVAAVLSLALNRDLKGIKAQDTTRLSHNLDIKTQCIGQATRRTGDDYKVCTEVKVAQYRGDYNMFIVLARLPRLSPNDFK